MQKIKFGTDGWRAIIAEDFTVENVNRVSVAVAKWLLQQPNLNPSIVIGYDCRFAGLRFMQEAAAVFHQFGIKTFTAPGPVSTPMVSMATRELQAGLGVVITASHNPPSYNGYKLKGHFGGPLLPHDIQAIEDLIDQPVSVSWSESQVEMYGMQALYAQALESEFDLQAIRNSSFRFAYDPMFGAGQFVMRQVFGSSVLHFNSEWNPLFGGKAPEPILRNLMDFQQLIQSEKNIDSGLATDGDADRIGLFNKSGDFIDSHHIILLLIHYMVAYKGMSGKVVAAFSVSRKLEKLCAHYQLELHTTQIGFKHITGYFLTDDVLLGGEESGGIAIKGHIPERDGIWMGLVIWEFMAKSGKSLDDLIQEVYSIVGPFNYDRRDLHLTENQKQTAMQRCAAGLGSLGSWKVEGIETIDGFKFLLPNDAWLLVRASGTEPVLRLYGETDSALNTQALLDAAEKALIPSNE
jgi:phosphomannomutase